VIVPARNEARNIERCLRSVLSTTYSAVEVIAVDDHSDDATGSIARAMAASDTRLRVLDSPALPAGWFGKQWACATGAAAARGELLLFIDADTWHAPDLLPRAVSAMRTRGADLLSAAGHQEMRTFWERLVQPQIFWMLLARYGGTEGIGRARRPENVIAAGQFMLVRRAVYEAVGGHAAVRDKAAEDLALAQQLVRANYRVAMVMARERLSTHMYASLAELIDGWGKNVYAAGIDAMPGGALGRVVFPFALPVVPLAMLAPAVVLVLALIGVLGSAWLLWSSICLAAGMVWWTLIYRGFEQPPWLTLLHPLGAAVVLYIFLRAIARGRRVAWKGREYVSR
jgi:chlorobactene glucosyltransferase